MRDFTNRSLIVDSGSGLVTLCCGKIRAASRGRLGLPIKLAVDLRCTLRTCPIREGEPSVVSLFSRFRFYVWDCPTQRATYALAKEPPLATTLSLYTSTG